MKTLPPINASFLAKGIYRVRDKLLLKGFIEEGQFILSQNDIKTLSAEVGSRLINARDAFGICARGGGEYANDVFLIFRGTTGANYGADVLTDLRFGLNITRSASFVHAGFNHAFNSMQNDIAEFFGSQQGIQTVHCIGHSLGGAVATLAADWVSEKYSFKVKLYSFGAPRVGFGNPGFASKLTIKLQPGNIHRVYHENDPVPMTPLFPFFHAPTTGLSCCLPSDSAMINVKSHYMDRYIASVTDKNWQGLRRPEPGFITDIKGWLQSDNQESIQSTTFWQKLNHAAAFVVNAVLAGIVLPVAAGLTMADYLAMILAKGISLTADVANWVFLLIRKMMRALGMAVVKTVEALTEQLIRLVLNRITAKIYDEVRRALNHFK